MADCFTAPGLMPFEQAKQTLLDAMPIISETETIEITQADKRVLAVDVTSPLNVPGHDNSAMDGFAICDSGLVEGQNVEANFKLVGSSFAGAPFDGELKQGECVRIMTGAVIPYGANSVVMQENVDKIENEVGKTVTLSQPAKFDNNIRKAGEDIQQGQTLFYTGYQLKAVDIGLLASLGLGQVEVKRKVKVAVFSTGDELKTAGETLSSGDIYESNTQVLTAMLERLNVQVTNLGIIPDDVEKIEQAFIQADQQADIVISSGGVSVGEADFTKDVLDKLGNIDFWKVAIKPGKPFAFGKLANSFFFGLPGNPVSATVTLHQLAIPAIRKMSGAHEKPAMRLPAITTANIRKRPGRMDFQRGIMSVNQNGGIEVQPLGAQGSGILSSVSRANCYIILAAENAGHAAGEMVQIEMFDEVIG